MATYTSVRIYQLRATKTGLRAGSRFVERILTQIERSAKINALQGKYTTGKLSQSIHKDGPHIVGRRVEGGVGSKKSYAGLVERGARVHNIFPKRAPHIYRFGRVRKPALKFIWHGRVAYFNQIPGGPGTIGRSHPGQKGKHYLADALRSVSFRNRIRFVVYEKP